MNELLRAGLTAPQKSLPSSLLYDELGSALFEAITLLPEYEVARVDHGLLERSVAEVLRALPGPLDVAELGPGHGRKARLLLGPIVARQAQTRFIAVDVSSAALEGCRRALEDLASVECLGVEATFIEGLRRAPAPLPGHRRLVLFLGSNLSNFDRRESLQFFHDVRSTLRPGDALLLTTDLEKAPERLLPAYDDALGVTAAFNKNVLVRLNREYGANFVLADFEHLARWVPAERRIEMHLRARRACVVSVPALSLTLRFEPSETLWTESSHRFNVDELARWGHQAGFSRAGVWVDERWPLALSLFIANPKS